MVESYGYSCHHGSELFTGSHVIALLDILCDELDKAGKVFKRAITLPMKKALPALVPIL